MRNEDLQLPSPARRARRAGRSRARPRRRSTRRNGSARPARTRRARRGQRRRRRRSMSATRRRSSATTPDSTSKGAYAILGGSVSRRGDDGYFADLTASDLGLDSRRLVRPGRARGPLYAAHRLCRDPAPPDRRRRDAVPRQRRQRADPAGGLSRGRHREHAARQHAAADRHRLQVPAPRPGRHVHRRRGLEPTASTSGATSATAPSRPPGSFFSTASQFLAPVNEKTDQSRSAFLCDQAAAGDAELPVLDVPATTTTALTWSNPFFPGGARRRPTASSRSPRTTSSSRSWARPATTSRRRSAPAPMSRSAA